MQAASDFSENSRFVCHLQCGSNGGWSRPGPRHPAIITQANAIGIAPAMETDKDPSQDSFEEDLPWYEHVSSKVQ